MQSHCMTVIDMMYHTKIQHPRILDDVITDVIKMMIDESIIFESISVNGINLYSCFKNLHLIQKIWIYIIQMNYSTAYDELVDAFAMTAQEEIADAIGIMIAKNIITKNKTQIRITQIERQNILHNHLLKD